MRTKHSVINMAVNLIGQLLNFILAIVSRSILASMLPGEYLGINGLFSNLLNVLSLAELGIGTAMLYAFYKPVAEDNRTEIVQLINFYRRLYRYVAAAVAVMGLLLVPFLGILIKEGGEVEHIVLIYLLYLLQSVSSYFFTYKAAVIIASQKQYICSIYSYICLVARYLFQIMALLVTHNFLVYLIVQIFFTVLPNILTARKAVRMFPYISQDSKALPVKEKQKEILKHIKALFFHRFGTIAVYNTDNLIMSAFVGLTGVGIYYNYQLISASLSTLLGQLFAGLSASIGNLVATQDKKRVHDIYRRLDLASYIAVGYCTVAMAVLFEPFIRMFFGEDFLLPRMTVGLLLAQFYLSGMRRTIQLFRDAMGTFWYDRYKPVAEVILNMAISLALVGRYGIAGVIAGTVISLLVVPFWIEPYVFFRYGMHEDDNRQFFGYFGRYLLRTLYMIAGLVVITGICSRITIGGMGGLMIKGMIVTVLYLLFMLLLFGRSQEGQGLKVMITEIYKRGMKHG